MFFYKAAQCSPSRLTRKPRAWIKIAFHQSALTATILCYSTHLEAAASVHPLVVVCHTIAAQQPSQGQPRWKFGSEGLQSVQSFRASAKLPTAAGLVASRIFWTRKAQARKQLALSNCIAHHSAYYVSNRLQLAMCTWVQPYTSNDCTLSMLCQFCA